MRFLIFLWNSFVRIVSFFGLILAEILVFSLVVKLLNSAGFNGLSTFLTVLFIIWLIIDIILKIFVGGGKSIIRYILKY